MLPAAALAARNRAPLLFHCHHRLADRASVWLARRALRYANATVVGACEFVLQPYRHPGPTHVVYNGVARSAALRSFAAGPVPPSA